VVVKVDDTPTSKRMQGKTHTPGEVGYRLTAVDLSFYVSRQMSSSTESRVV
jgi:hypothetical protein